jgi:tetratricopeptide (TPR) repeat protein
MPTKTGRNDPCPCGNGQKYKRCCWEKDQAAEHAQFARVAAQAAAGAAAERQKLEASLDQAAAFREQQEALKEASNTPIRLIKAGKLDEAEQAARELLARYPEVHDGYDRLGMVCEARGDHKQAADYYRKVIEFIRAHPDDYDDPQFEAVFHRLVAKLDPPTAT